MSGSPSSLGAVLSGFDRFWRLAGGAGEFSVADAMLSSRRDFFDCFFFSGCVSAVGGCGAPPILWWYAARISRDPLPSSQKGMYHESKDVTRLTEDFPQAPGYCLNLGNSSISRCRAVSMAGSCPFFSSIRDL